MENRSINYFKQYFLLLALVLNFTQISEAQILDVSGFDAAVYVDNCCNGQNSELSGGHDQDYTLPFNVSFNAVTFDLRGGDGGSAQAGSDCKSEGGDGAITRVTCLVGDGPNMLRPGSKIRFVVGKHGEDTDVPGTAGTGGGGGGGTAVLYQPNSGDNWIILAVAGGGGGAYQGNVFGGCVDSETGAGGRDQTSGGNGGGSDGGAGGTNGGAGSRGDRGTFLVSGSGGGAYGGGSSTFGDDGHQGYPNGGIGGNPSYGNDGNYGIGGFGFGGGGAGGGSAAGAGGGGYSGGGSGESLENGGGGGSYINSTYAYLFDQEAGGSDSGTAHGRVFYQFKNICVPEIASIDEVIGFCGGSNVLAEIKVNLTTPDNCDGLFYKLGGSGVSILNQTGEFAVTNPGNYVVQLFYYVDGTINVVDEDLFYINDTDILPPVAKCISSYDVNMSVGIKVFANFDEVLDDGSYDNCGIVSKVASKTVFTCGDIGTSNITLTLTDEAGNTSTCTTQVTVRDVAGPIPDVSNLPTITSACTASITNIPTATDNCVINPITATTNDPLYYSIPGTYTINWTYVDDVGHTTTQTQTVIVTDDSPPVAICPQDVIVELTTDDCSAVVNYAATSTDNCEDIIPAVTYMGNSSTVPAGTDRLLLVQVRHQDPSGVHTMSYDGKPMTLAIREIREWGSNIYLDVWYVVLGTGGEINSTAQIGGLGALASVEYITFEHVDQDNPIGDMDGRSRVEEDLEVYARIHDLIYEGAGRSSHTSVDPLSGQTEIFDVRPPGLSGTRTWGAYMAGSDANQTLSINYPQFALHVALVLQARHATSYAYDIAPGSTFQAGVTPVTFIVTDKANQTGACAFNVIVRDAADPTVACPNNITLNANLDSGGGCTASASFGVTTTDDCTTPSLSQTAGLASGADFPVGTTTNTFVSTDAGGRTATCSFTVTVNDVQSPTALCKNKTIQLDTDGNAAITTTDIDNGSSDNCGDIASLTLDVTSFDCDDIGAHMVTLTVKDDYDNTSTCQATVTVEDNIAPTAICKNKTIQLDTNGEGVLTTADIDNNSSDICGIGTLSLDVTSFDCDDLGNHTVTLTVKDVHNNASTCQATVTVKDDVPATALCQNKTLQLNENGTGSISAPDIDNSSNDACGVASISIDKKNFDCDDIGTNAVTLTVSDLTGNISTCQATVTVEDNIAPTALCQNKTVQLDEEGNATITPQDINNNSTDNCGISGIALDNDHFDCTDAGQDRTVILTVKDIEGNSSTCTATITVEDNILPTITCKDATIVLAYDESEAEIDVQNLYEYVDYNCGEGYFTTPSPSRVYCSDIGSPITVTVTVTSVQGGEDYQMGSCTSTVTVLDNDAPITVCHDISVGLDVNGHASITPDDIDGEVFGSNIHPSIDNCDFSTSIDISSFDCSNIGVNQVTLTATDVSGNSDQCVSNVTVVEGGALPSDWQSADIGQTGVGNDYWYATCDYPPTYYVTGGGNNATNMMADNIAFLSYNTCGDFTFSAKIDGIDPNGYGGLMVREGMDAGAKQVALFSNMSNTLRHEVRYSSNSPKQVSSFFKPNPIWLRLERQGDWIFSYRSYDGTNFQYVHSVFISMEDCVEVGLSSFTYMPGSQTESVFSNVSISGSNGGFSEGGISLAIKPSSTTLNLNLYPNPNNGLFTIELDESLKQTTSLYIYNHFGQQVHRQQIQEGMIQAKCYLDQLPAGMYWLKVGEREEYTTKPFIVTR